MKQELITIHEQAMNLIKILASKGDAAGIARIAVTANKVQQLQEQIVHIEQEIPRLKEILGTYAQSKETPRDSVNETADFGGNGHTNKKKLRIEIDWTRLGKLGGKEVIHEHKSSETMAKWASRFFQEFGVQVLQKLSGFRISRGPMVSNAPKFDYVNKAEGTPYSHLPIADSGYYILTHSQNTQKVGDIRKACQLLGLPLGAVLVDEVEKDDMAALRSILA